jgi:hemerythrin
LKKIKWTDKLSTEVRSLDQHHSDLIDEFNTFIQAIEDGKDIEALTAIFQNIIDGAITHFQFEERIMQNIGFQGYAEHKNHHSSLLKDATVVLNDIKNANDTKEIMIYINFLRALILKHMVEQDLKIKEFMTRGT